MNIVHKLKTEDMSRKLFIFYAIGFALAGLPFIHGAFTRTVLLIFPECKFSLDGRSPCSIVDSMGAAAWVLGHMVGTLMAFGALMVAVAALVHLSSQIKNGASWKHQSIVVMLLFLAALVTGYGLYLQSTFRL